MTTVDNLLILLNFAPVLSPTGFELFGDMVGVVENVAEGKYGTSWQSKKKASE